MLAEGEAAADRRRSFRRAAAAALYRQKSCALSRASCLSITRSLLLCMFACSDIMLAEPLNPAPPAGGQFAFHAPHAEVIVNVSAPFPSWRWLKLQLLSVNWATLALVITVLAVSSNINAQLDEQRAQGIVSQRQMAELDTLLKSSSAVANSLTGMHAELQVFNASLNEAKAVGLGNLTARLSLINTFLDTGFADPYRVIPVSNDRSASAIRLTLTHAGTWAVGGYVQVNNGNMITDKLCGCIAAGVSQRCFSNAGDVCISVTRQSPGDITALLPPIVLSTCPAGAPNDADVQLLWSRTGEPNAYGYGRIWAQLLAPCPDSA